MNMHKRIFVLTAVFCWCWPGGGTIFAKGVISSPPGTFLKLFGRLEGAIDLWSVKKAPLYQRYLALKNEPLQHRYLTLLREVDQNKITQETVSEIISRSGKAVIVSSCGIIASIMGGGPVVLAVSAGSGFSNLVIYIGSSFYQIFPQDAGERLQERLLALDRETLQAVVSLIKQAKFVDVMTGREVDLPPIVGISRPANAHWIDGLQYLNRVDITSEELSRLLQRKLQARQLSSFVLEWKKSVNTLEVGIYYRRSGKKWNRQGDFALRDPQTGRVCSVFVGK